ncbi:MAG TPA: DUF721 domain-containing protein [Lentimicrobium sp.]|nr:DUF721 domain-containing protein [Lentimicrobium sp.]
MTDNDQSIKEALEEWMKRYRHREQFLNGKAIAAWDGIVGPIISKETENLFISKKVLFVKLRSEALKHELEYAKRKLVKSINKEAGAEVVTEIIFT